MDKESPHSFSMQRMFIEVSCIACGCAIVGRFQQLGMVSLLYLPVIVLPVLLHVQKKYWSKTAGHIVGKIAISVAVATCILRSWQYGFDALILVILLFVLWYFQQFTIAAVGFFLWATDPRRNRALESEFEPDAPDLLPNGRPIYGSVLEEFEPSSMVHEKDRYSD